MPRWLKVVHIVGMTLFLGSIPGHVLIGAVAPLGGDIPPPGIVFAREVVKAATVFITLPGLGLAVLSGLIMLWRRRPHALARAPWLTVHAVLGLLMLGNAVALIVPAEIALAAQAHQLMDGSGFDPALWRHTERIEAIAGGVNVLLALVSVALAVLRPALGRRGQTV